MRKSRFNERQRQAIVDAYLKGSRIVEQLSDQSGDILQMEKRVRRLAA